MGWQRGQFDGKPVWVEVEVAGSPKVSQGRVPIRFTAGPQSKIYTAGIAKIQLDENAPIEEVSGGVAAVPKLGKVGARTALQAKEAASFSKELIASLGSEEILVYTDGAAKGNPGVAGSGALLVLPNGRRGEKSCSLGRATNNIAELTAVALALDLLEEANVSTSASISILTDSKYAHGILAKNWKALANRELITDLRARLKPWSRLSIRWVAGHVGVEGNEAADRLANEGVAGSSTTRWLEA